MPDPSCLRVADVAERTPQRIQRRRIKGWRMPEGAVNCCRPGPWGNPFTPGKPYRTVIGTLIEVRDADHAVRLYRPIAWAQRERIIRELRGKTLMCFCKVGAPCHADLLLDIANAD